MKYVEHYSRLCSYRHVKLEPWGENFMIKPQITCSEYNKRISCFIWSHWFLHLTYLCSPLHSPFSKSSYYTSPVGYNSVIIGLATIPWVVMYIVCCFCVVKDIIQWLSIVCEARLRDWRTCFTLYDTQALPGYHFIMLPSGIRLACRHIL